MPINADYEYFEAEKKYLEAQSQEDKIAALEELIRKAPKHKSSENLLAGLKTRLKKLKEKSERSRKMGGGRKGIKKEGFQVVLLGYPNSGKSSLLAALTNARPSISPHPYSTRQPELGSMNYEGVPMQLVDLPSVGSEAFDIGIVNTSDCIILVIDSSDPKAIDHIASLQALLSRVNTKEIIIAFTKVELFDSSEFRRFQERCRSRRITGAHFVSAYSQQGLNDLKKRIFESMNVIRVYTKEPGKAPAVLPVVLPVGSSVRDVGESILNGFCKSVIETRLTGPSAKFANQKVGLTHILKDKDIVEFHTR